MDQDHTLLGIAGTRRANWWHNVNNSNNSSNSSNSGNGKSISERQ